MRWAKRFIVLKTVASDHMINTAILRKTPIESWTLKKIGVDGDDLSTEKIRQYQLRKLREVIRWVCLYSPFYRTLFQGLAQRKVACLADLSNYPFTTDQDIKKNALQFLCVSQNKISRVVSLSTSGTTGEVKRLYFTPADQELTIDFFRQGMSTLVNNGDRVLLLLPGERTGSVGDLLATALTRLGAVPIPHGIVADIGTTLKVIAREKVDSLVGIPTQILALGRYADSVIKESFRLKSVLLSTDYVSQAIVRELRRIFSCEVFEHYGMTEMGLGGGIDCAAHQGYHLREADLYFEIIDPLTGAVLPEGQEGEVVFTTLTRQAMPLIRYRTGDISRFFPEQCCCGTILKRLDRIARRRDGRIFISENCFFTIADLDEALFVLAEIMHFTASVDNVRQAARLVISVSTAGLPSDAAKVKIYQALDTIPAIHWARSTGKLMILVDMMPWEDIFSARTAKRVIMELNKTNGSTNDIFDKAWENSNGR